jgi:MFS family permease
MSETYEPVLLRRKAKRLRNSTGNTSLRARMDLGNGGRKLKAFKEAMLMPFRMLLFCRPIFFTSLLTAIGYGYLLILYTTLLTTFLETYHWKPKTIGLAYLGIGVGNLVGGVVGGMLSDRIVKVRAAKGDTRPENRLLPMIFSWPMVSVGLLVYAWTAHGAVHWVAPLMGTAVFGAGR